MRANHQLSLLHERVNTPPGIEEDKNKSDQSQRIKAERKRSASWYNHHNGNGGTVRIFENELQILEPKRNTELPPPPKREEMDINKFTKKSRFRVLQRFNQLQTKSLSAPLFITLTTRHGSMNAERFQNRFRKSFLPSLKKIIPDLVYAWRLEPHKDGYPHYHLFVWTFKKETNLNSKRLKQKIRAFWLKAIDDESNATRMYSCKIVPVKSIRKAMSYVGKYMAKEGSPIEDGLYGRRWGTSTNFPAKPIMEVDLPLMYVKKLKRIVKRLLKQRGGHFLKSLPFLEDDADWRLWVPFDLIHKAVDELGVSSARIALDYYNETGVSPPPADYGLDWFASKGINLRDI